MRLAVICRCLCFLQVPPKAALSFQHYVVSYPQSCHSRAVLGAEEGLGHTLVTYPSREPYEGFLWSVLQASFHKVARNFSRNSEITCEEHIPDQKYPGEDREGGLGLCSRSWEHILQSAIELHCSSAFCAGMQAHQILRTRVRHKCPQIRTANIILMKLLQIVWSHSRKL